MEAFFAICEYFSVTPQEYFDETADQPELLHAAIGGMRQLSDSVFLMLLGIINRLKQQ